MSTLFRSSHIACLQQLFILIAASHLPGLLLLLLCFLLYILLLVDLLYCYREDYQCIYVYPPAPFVSYPPPHQAPACSLWCLVPVPLIG